MFKWLQQLGRKITLWIKQTSAGLLAWEVFAKTCLQALERGGFCFMGCSDRRKWMDEYTKDCRQTTECETCGREINLPQHVFFLSTYYKLSNEQGFLHHAKAASGMELSSFVLHFFFINLSGWCHIFGCALNKLQDSYVLIQIFFCKWHLLRNNFSLLFFIRRLLPR